MTKTKLGIVGLGGIAQVIHMPVLSKMEDIEIVAVCDSEISKSKSIAAKYNVGKYYRDVDKMLEENPWNVSSNNSDGRRTCTKMLQINALMRKKIFLLKSRLHEIIKKQRNSWLQKRIRGKLWLRWITDSGMTWWCRGTFIKAKEIGEVFISKQDR